MVRDLKLVSLLTLAVLTFIPSFAAAQTGSAIAGTVKDATGGVLPGVTVEASSPALIEGMRTVVTDNEGLYNITELRPGIYTVTFTLPGFSTIQREGIELTSAFTAMINADLRVGTLEETITVQGGSPTVDVQSVVQRRVVTRDVMDAVPSGNRSWASLAMLVPGAKVTGGANVGGTTSPQAAATIHGSRSQESMMLFDGMRYNQGLGTGGSRNAFTANDGNVEQISFETASLSAESEVGGFVHNVIPKEGGNTFKGSFATNYTHHSFQSDNLSDEQRTQVASSDSIQKMWDFNPALGGPIVQSRLWFFTAFRNWGYERRVANRFFNQTPYGLSYTPDLSRPAVDYQQKISANLRLTSLLTEKSKLSVHYENQADLGDYRYGNRLYSPEALSFLQQNPNYIAQAKWQLPATSRFLVEMGWTFVNNDFNSMPNASTIRELPAITEVRTGVAWRNTPGTWGHNASHQTNVSGSVSYVTGSHTFKTGGIYLRGNLTTTQDASGNATSWRFLDGKPSAVVVFATPLRFLEDLNSQSGVYAQDQWRINHLTINMGLRFDYYNASVPAQPQGQGIWVPTRDITFPEVENVPNWKDIMPRFGMSYDVFGTGKTALKATMSKYVFGSELVTYTRLANPSASIATSATRTWNDVNGDFTPQESELGAVSARDFGTPRITQRYDPAINNGFGKRGNNWETSATIEHELFPGVATSAAFFHRWWHNLSATQNQGVTAADFDPYCVTAPLDSRLPGGGGNQVCGFYDVKPEKFGVTDNVITSAATFGEQRDSYDGVDLSVNVRLPGHATLAGGTNTERTRTNVCYGATDPSLSPSTLTSISLQNGRSLNDCDIRSPWQTQVKFYGVYPLPWAGIQLSAAFQSQPGAEISASYTARNAEIVPTLGRNLSSGTSGTTTVQLIPSSTVYGDTLNQLDFRATKSFHLGRTEVQTTFDMYNMLNANPVLAYNTTYGPSYLTPTNILIGRLLKFGMQLRF